MMLSLLQIHVFIHKLDIIGNLDIIQKKYFYKLENLYIILCEKNAIFIVGEITDLLFVNSRL